MSRICQLPATSFKDQTAADAADARTTDAAHAGSAMAATALKNAGAAEKATMTPEAAKALHQKREAAQKFEAIFVRQMLAKLEKTSKPDGTSGGSGGGIYGSMMVNSLADSISQAGGIGLSDVILQAMQGPQAAGAPKK